MADNTFLTGTRAIEKQIIFGDTRNEKKSSFRQNSKFKPVFRKKINDEKKRKNKWAELIAKLTFKKRHEPIPYDEPTNVRPGIKFWQYLGNALVRANNIEKNDKKVKKLKGPRIFIPKTFGNMAGSNTFWFWTDPKTGRVKVKEDASYPDFERELELEKNLHKNRNKNEPGQKSNLDQIEKRRKNEYFIAYRRKTNDFETNTDVHSIEKWNQVRSTSSGFSDWSLIQEFIYPKGHQVSVTRMVFHTRHNEKHIANYAYKMRNNMRLDNQKKQNREKATLDKEKAWSFEVTKLTGGALVGFEIPTRNLVAFLERAYPIRIKRIVLDFITGRDGINYLFNVKYINLEHAPVEMNQKDKKRTLDELTCSVYCKLCGLIFKKDEASKTLTYKLLWELSQHLKKRGRELKNIEISHSSTRPCRVCDLCYMVVVSEHELIELEQQFARAQNIPIKDPYLRVPIEKKAKHRPALLSENLKQWRFMMYLEYLYFEAEDIGLFEGKDSNVDLDNIHLQIKISNLKNDFLVKLERADTQRDPELKNVQWNGRQVYKLKLLRVYYFFSESLDIDNFLSETEIQIRLTHTKDWNNYIAHGSTKTLSNFQRYREKGQKHESRVYLFFDNAKYCTLKMMGGLVCDGDFNTASMNLHKFNGIYFPDEDFYNCNIFPEEWIEIFLGEHEYLQSEEIGEQEKKIQPYTPICTVSELKKMLQGNVKSTKYSNIKPKTETRLDVDALWVQLNELKINNGFKPSKRYLNTNGNYTVGGSSHTKFRIASGNNYPKKNRPMTSVPMKKQKKPRLASSKIKQLIDQNAEIEQEFKEDVKRIIHKNGDEDLDLFNVGDMPKLDKSDLEKIYKESEESRSKQGDFKTREQHVSKLSKQSQNHEDYLSKRVEEIEENDGSN